MQLVSVGEALIDMMSLPVDEKDACHLSYKACAGGAPANVAVAVAKLGGKSALVSKLGDDQFARFICKELTRYGVELSSTRLCKKSKTAVAMVSFDEDNERSFDFYLENAAHTRLRATDVASELFCSQSLFHFCSGSVAIPELEEQTNLIIQTIRQTGALISLDINYRPAFWQDTQQAPNKILKLAEQSDVVKASRDELIDLYGAEQVEQLINQWAAKGILVLLTNGPHAVEYIYDKFSGKRTTPKVTAQDTTAAGDSFIGGFLYQAISQSEQADDLKNWLSDHKNLVSAIDFATRCGAHTVTQVGSFSALPRLHNIQHPMAVSA
ncbi:carbohydrate kinase family protein [Gayadomonas joobiniege]|uniref:carbohydrate kinase family protein n=1 Tax=Gayadomonas joobiniege TaxID=1234606 RepID=UPI000370EF53|nr:carbohydrate kinase [Gayadomonas joobiniege]